MAPADYARAVPLTIRCTVPPGCDERRRIQVPSELTAICAQAFNRWLNVECAPKYAHAQAIAVDKVADRFNADCCFRKLRARLVVHPIADCHIVADGQHKITGGNGTAREKRVGRFDFVEVFDGHGNPDHNSVCRVVLIVSYRFGIVDSETHKFKSSFRRTQFAEGQYVLLHKLTPKLESPFTLLDFHREQPKDKHTSYSWLPLSTVLRPVCAIPNFARAPPGAKKRSFGAQDGWLLARKLQ
jgi:hypothetical protein